jgi:O-antigen biosynthesis protein
MIDIIIPVVDLLPDTKACVDSVNQASVGEEYRLIIVDNGSQKETSNYLKSLNCILIRNENNLGFVKAINQGLNRSSGDVILLNNDTLLPEGWIGKLKAVATVDEKIGLVGPLSESGGGNQSQQDLSWIQERNDFPLPTTGNKYLLTEAIAFFCVYIKRSVINSIGVLDENFGFGQSDDVDYCIRAMKAGFKIALATDLVIQHQVSATFSYLKMDKVSMYAKNKGYLYQKHPDYFK